MKLLLISVVLKTSVQDAAFLCNKYFKSLMAVTVNSLLIQ